MMLNSSNSRERSWFNGLLAAFALSALTLSLPACSAGGGSKTQKPGGGGDTTSLDGGVLGICANGNCEPGGTGECNGSTTVVIRGLAGPKLATTGDAGTGDDCTQTIDWGGDGGDAPPPVDPPPLTEDYSCPTGTIRVHVRDVWSKLASPSLNLIDQRPFAALLIETSMWSPTAARAETAGCDWYSVCAPQPYLSQFRLGYMGPDTCSIGTQNSSGIFDISSFSGASDIWIDYVGSAGNLQADYSAARVAADGFRVTSDKNAVASELCAAGPPDSTIPEGYTKLHIRWFWGDPSVTGFAGTACEQSKLGFSTPPYPTSLKVQGECNSQAMLELQNGDCPWYYLLIPNSEWTTGGMLQIWYPDQNKQFFSAGVKLPERTANEYWLAYTGPPDNIAWSGEGMECQNYSTRDDSYHFFTANPGPGYQGCGGAGDVKLDPCSPPTPESYHTIHFRYIWAGQKIFTFFPSLKLMPEWIIMEVTAGAGSTLPAINVTCLREADRPWFNCQVPDGYFAEGSTWRAVDKTSAPGETEWNTVNPRPLPTEPKEYWLRWYYGKPDYGGEFKFFDFYPDGIGGDWSATGAWNDQDCAPKPPSTPVSLGFGGWFPYNETNYTYPYGTSLARTFTATDTVQGLFNYLVQERYLIWKENYVYYDDDACGKGTARVHRDDPADTVSEGQGYGMAITAAIGDKELFDKLWRFARHYMSQGSKKYCGGLMGWMWTQPSECRPLDTPCDIDKESCSGNGDSAFDGDVDIAIGLVYAAMQWPEYRGAALGWLLKMECEVNTTFDGKWAYPTPGDTFDKNCQFYETGNPNSKPCGYAAGNNGQVNVGYYPPGYFRVFGDFLQRFLDPNRYSEDVRKAHRAFWYKTAETVYEMVERCYDQGNVNPGLVTDWGTYNAPCSSNSDNYNWARALWRLGVDAAWFGNRTDLNETMPGSSGKYPTKSRMQAKIDNIQEFFNNFYLLNPVEPNANRFSTICQNLMPDGLVTDCDPAYGHNSYFVGSAACAYVSIFDDDGKTTADIRREAIEEAVSTAIMNDKYYQESIGVYQLLFLTGNFPNPLEVP